MANFTPDENLSQIFRAISTPARFQILMAIGAGEACVCHLEAKLDMRQAYISQQLMEMREAGLLDTRRDGRYIYYRLSEPALIDLLIEIGKLFGISPEDIQALLNTNPIPQCCCPNCVAQRNPNLITEEEISS